MLEASNCINLMYLCIIKIKINIYIFYTSFHGTAMNGQSIPLSHLTELEIWVLWILPPVLELWLICARKKKSLRSSFDFIIFFFLQVALSFGGSQFWGSGHKHLLHSLSRPFPPATSPAPHLQARCAPCTKAPWTHMHANSQNTPGSVEGLPGTEDGPGAFWCYFLHGNPTAVEVTGFLCFSPAFFLCG